MHDIGGARPRMAMEEIETERALGPASGSLYLHILVGT